MSYAVLIYKLTKLHFHRALIREFSEGHFIHAVIPADLSEEISSEDSFLNKKSLKELFRDSRAKRIDKDCWNFYQQEIERELLHSVEAIKSL